MDIECSSSGSSSYNIACSKPGPLLATLGSTTTEPEDQDLYDKSVADDDERVGDKIEEEKEASKDADKSMASAKEDGGEA